MKFEKFEIFIFLALILMTLAGAYAQSKSEKLSSGMIRLHVIANSDTKEDQALKLKVRDSVLEKAGELTKDAESAFDAAEIIENGIEEIRAAAAQRAAEENANYTVSAQLDREYYETREYDSFSLPAGEYTSLKIILGEGNGHNWWCVVFPPLCTADAEEFDAVAASFMDGDTVRLITKDSGGYVIKFKFLELFGKLKKVL